MEDRGAGAGTGPGAYDQLIVIAVAALVFLGCILSPPALMDDVDAVQAQIARNMLDSGDWVTARLNGVAYLEKSPLLYWMMAASMAIFGPHDWAARIPLALMTVLLCWLTFRFACWAFGRAAGFYTGLALSTSVGLFLFTRIQIPDAILTLSICAAMWCLMRALEDNEPNPRRWAYLYWAAIGVGLLLKGLIAALFPIATAALYVYFAKRDWRRLHPFTGIWVTFVIAAPWHLAATLRNPPYFDLSMSSEPANYRGFFWFYFMNEHVLRFLNLRYPRDYNTVPRLYFWLFHLLWLFPWSLYLPAVFKSTVKPDTRAARARLLCLCWTLFVLIFFTFSTTQEYYSMPVYPALAMLIGMALAEDGKLIPFGTRMAAALATMAIATISILLYAVRDVVPHGDIASALTSNPDVYTLSLGHMTDLTLHSFAYLRAPLILAAIAFLIGAAGAWWMNGRRAAIVLAVMMALFFHAARLALVSFDPYLGSRPLAEALNRAPEGRLIIDDQYYAFSSVFFYTNRKALLLNGRVNNLEYGSYAPGAPAVFIDDTDFETLWYGEERCYLVVAGPSVARFEEMVGAQKMYSVASSGGKFVFSNQAVPRR